MRIQLRISVEAKPAKMSSKVQTAKTHLCAASPMANEADLMSHPREIFSARHYRLSPFTHAIARKGVVIVTVRHVFYRTVLMLPSAEVVT